MNIRFLTIRDWMLQLGLSYTELVAFALVWSFSRDGESWFQGSASTVAKWMGKATKRPALNALASLVEKRLIEKRERWENGVRYCDYRALGDDALKALGVEPEEHQGGVEMTPGVVSKKHRGGVKTTTHNNNNNIDNGYPHNKQDAHTRVDSVHGERFMEMWGKLLRQPGWETKSADALDECMKDLNAVTEDEAVEMVRNSIKNGWKGVFPLPRKASESDIAIAAAKRMEQDIDKDIAARAAANENKI